MANSIITGGFTNSLGIGFGAVPSANNSIVLGNGANVGIGLTNPTSPLHVVGNSTLGTVISGTWNGGIIGVGYGGSGVDSSNPVIQQLRTSTSSVITCNTAVPIDNTIPQITEGNQVLTLAITPKNASNILMIEAYIQGTIGAANTIVMALFVDSTANALACSFFGIATNFNTQFSVRYYLAAGSTSARTYRLRVGPQSSTFYVNGANGGGALFGGVMRSYMFITEMSA